MSAVHSVIPLGVPGRTDIQLTYLRVLGAMGGTLVLLWMAGLLDVALQRAQVRRRDAMLLARDQELMRTKSGAYDQQRSALADIKEPLEGIAQDTRAMLTRMEAALWAMRGARSDPIARKRVDARFIRKTFPPADPQPAEDHG
jgi:hypothetical protein